MRYVGYSQDSMTAAEFDITEVLKQSKKRTDGGGAQMLVNSSFSFIFDLSKPWQLTMVNHFMHNAELQY